MNPKKPNHVYKLRKALYGLKQAPRAWYKCLTKFLIEKGFEIGKIDATLFTRRVNGELFAKYMWMILSLVLLTHILVKSLESWCQRNMRCQWCASWNSSLDCKSKNQEVHQGLNQEVQYARVQRYENLHAY